MVFDFVYRLSYIRLLFVVQFVSKAEFFHAKTEFSLSNIEFLKGCF